MKIKGSVHCLFEQSGIFRDEFLKLGIQANDYDISNYFGKTDVIVDLFYEIEKAYDNIESIFDAMSKKDLIIAFFPCTYFSGISQMGCLLSNLGYVGLEDFEKVERIMERFEKRHQYLMVLSKLVYIACKRKLRLIIENPYRESYLLYYFMKSPDYTDFDRAMRGDMFTKPTNYWFFNCHPTNLQTYQRPKRLRKIMSIGNGRLYKQNGNIERSLMTSDYAKNFIKDKILGIPGANTQLNIFENQK